MVMAMKIIIPYQVITGNYDAGAVASSGFLIIPYQVITGNYDTVCKIIRF